MPIHSCPGPRRPSVARRILPLFALLFAFGFPAYLIYYISSMMKRILKKPDQLWYCSVGFELTPSYATAGFSCERGTEAALMGPILLVEGDEAYRKTMFQLSVDSFYNIGTDEIENFSRMFSKLVEASTPRTGSYIGSAVLSYPELPGLVANDTGELIFRKAFKGIEAITNITYEQVLHTKHDENDIHSVHAILAGHGLGLCQPWTTEDESSHCKEDQSLPATSYFLAGYYSHGLEIVLTEKTKSVYDIKAYTYNNYSLGYHSIPPREDIDLWLAYWDDLRDFLRNALLEHPDLRPQMLILYGDGSTDGHFQTVLDMVLRQAFGDDRPKSLVDGVDPDFAGAIGGTELLKRERYRKLCREGRRNGR